MSDFYTTEDDFVEFFSDKTIQAKLDSLKRPDGTRLLGYIDTRGVLTVLYRAKDGAISVDTVMREVLESAKTAEDVIEEKNEPDYESIEDFVEDYYDELLEIDKERFEEEFGKYEVDSAARHTLNYPYYTLEMNGTICEITGDNNTVGEYAMSEYDGIDGLEFRHLDDTDGFDYCEDEFHSYIFLQEIARDVLRGYLDHSDKKPDYPRLQFYTDETWGYNVWDEERKKREGVSVKFQQGKNEPKGHFLDRIGLSPDGDEYGSQLSRDMIVREYPEDDRISLVEKGYALDVLAHDEAWRVRLDVANLGECLDILVHDEAWPVREEVARQGYGLDILVHDENWVVRAEVARHGYGLDFLVHDGCASVREAVAEQGFGLDILINDENWRVREKVVKQGYGLDVLTHDKNEYVRAAVAEQGYDLGTLIHDKSLNVRGAVAEQGFGLDTLIHDEDWGVRYAVAKQGYGLDVLINDKIRHIREEVERSLQEEGYPSIESWIEANPKKCADRKNL